MKTWTVDEMMAEQPCPKYARKVVEKLWAGRESLSLIDVLALDIPAADRMWAVWRPGALTKEQEAALLEKIVTRAVTNHALHCGIEAVEKWAAKWLSGEDRTAAAAWAAAARAAWAAAAWAAWAAWAAARAEARAAWAAEARAAWAAAPPSQPFPSPPWPPASPSSPPPSSPPPAADARAAWAADAEYDQQVADVISILGPEK